MKKAVSILLATVLCMILLTACGQTPVSPDSSLPQDTSTTTTTTTEDTTTTTTTTEETTTTTAETTTTTKPTSTTKKPTTTTTKPTTTTTTTTAAPTTTTTTTVTTTQSTTAADPDAPPANQQRMSLCFSGRTCTLEYDYTEWDKDSGRKKWIYVESLRGVDYPISCSVDAETGRIVHVLKSVRRNLEAVVEEDELRDCFEKYYAESNLSPLYLEKAEYNIHTHGTSTGTVTIILNDAGDMIRWNFGKVYKVHMTSVGVVLADPDVYPDELADFYKPTYIE